MKKITFEVSSNTTIENLEQILEKKLGRNNTLYESIFNEVLSITESIKPLLQQNKNLRIKREFKLNNILVQILVNQKEGFLDKILKIFR